MSKVDIRNIDRVWEDYLTPVLFDDDWDILTPKKLPMRLNAEDEKHIEIRKDSWDYMPSDKIGRFYRYLNNWIPTLVGTPFNEAYSKLLKTFPERIDRIDTRKEFKSILNMDDCRELKPRKKTKYVSMGGYYVDEEGIIRHIGWKQEERKSVIIPKENGIVNKWFIDRGKITLEVLDRIHVLFGPKWANIFANNEFLTEQEYNELHRQSNCCAIITEEIKPTWGYYLGRWGKHNTKEIKNIESFLTKKSFYADYDELFEGTNEYERYIAELRDKKKKELRERLKAYKEKNKLMLEEAEHWRKEARRKREAEEFELKN
jgi:hypothetical protein